VPQVLSIIVHNREYVKSQINLTGVDNFPPRQFCERWITNVVEEMLSSRQSLH
jgi:hypothetical protein